MLKIVGSNVSYNCLLNITHSAKAESVIDKKGIVITVKIPAIFKFPPRLQALSILKNKKAKTTNIYFY